MVEPVHGNQGRIVVEYTCTRAVMPRVAMAADAAGKQARAACLPPFDLQSRPHRECGHLQLQRRQGIARYARIIAFAYSLMI